MPEARIPVSADATGEDSFIERHADVVLEVINRCRARGLPTKIEIADLQQAGRLGLLRAARSFDAALSPERAWAWKCVRREVYAVIRAQWGWATTTEPVEQLDAAGSPQARDHREIEAKLARQFGAEARTVVDHTELVAIIEEAKVDLSDRQRDLLDLVCLHQMSPRQIGRGKLLGMGWRLTMKEYHQALAKVRVRLERSGIRAA